MLRMISQEIRIVDSSSHRLQLYHRQSHFCMEFVALLLYLFVCLFLLGKKETSLSHMKLLAYSSITLTAVVCELLLTARLLIPY